MVVIMVLLAPITVNAAGFSGQREVSIERLVEKDSPYEIMYTETVSFHMFDSVSLNVNMGLSMESIKLDTLEVQPLDVNVNWSVSDWNFILGGKAMLFGEKGANPKTVYLTTQYAW